MELRLEVEAKTFLSFLLPNYVRRKEGKRRSSGVPPQPASCRVDLDSWSKLAAACCESPALICSGQQEGVKERKREETLRR
ncbi:hypothetical protein EYF80_038516 [Liparis tanakae]|uniref:Uncharacterized protein n=1 Tax=Liparis tanakae TaxID=230148 RepID=A0A4Z2GCM0_9TELE|nr:hypothetical protein EYF80_038516 [Liparis tanakae]